VRQKTPYNRSEVETLRSSFKHFDVKGTGYVNFKSFCEAFKRFGIVLDTNMLGALFSEFDNSREGRIRYGELAAALYDYDVAHHSYSHGNTNIKQLLPNKTHAIEDRQLFISSTLPGGRKDTKSLPTVIFVLGGPGSGKGTQCKHIVTEFGFVHLSAGDLLREEQLRQDSPYSKLINDYIKDGKIVPVEITVQLLKNAIDQNAQQGRQNFLVDGFPRNEDNKQGWEKLIGDSVRMPFVLYFDLAKQEMQRRILSRGQTSGRSDDNLASIQKRFRVFEEETMPVIRSFSQAGQIRVVSAVPPSQLVYEEVRKIIQQAIKR